MKATWKGEVLAAANATRRVDGYAYFPRESVRMSLLQAAGRNGDDLACPNDVRFYDVVVDEVRGERLAWSYEAPRGPMKPVDHWIGFRGDVDIA